jgi:hypothetical protein
MSDSGPRSPGYNEFASLLAPALRKAAATARQLEGLVENTPKRHESTAVKQALTRADTATQEIILRSLLEHFPQVCLAAEEDTESVRLFPETSDARVIIDPIDGTLRSYLERRGPYAVIVGLTLADRYQAALVAMPREGLLFDAQRGGGARIGRMGRSMQRARASADGDRILVANGTAPGIVERLRDLGYEVIFGCGGAVSVAPLIPGVRAGLRRGNTPQGISIRGRIGALIAREAGAVVKGAGQSAFPEDSHTRAEHLLVAACEEDIVMLDAVLSA